MNDILSISKLESGTQELTFTTYNFTLSIKDTIQNLYELVKKDGYNIVFEYEQEVEVYADELKITLTLYNLLINAINYTGSDKTIKIRQIVEERYVKLEVEDSGEGIASDDLPYIWDRYYKVEKNHKRAITGTGLGLSIVKK